MNRKTTVTLLSPLLGLALVSPGLSAQTATATPAPSESEEVVRMSPFEVKVEDRGYYAPNTMSGTRLNSKIEDLASSVTVVTKQQMSDFAMLNIDDIFLYEANTEGMGTYTDFTFDNGGSPIDITVENPTRANRVRGVGPANISLGNVEMSGRVPIDPINIDAVEISRGPNSTVFGVGNAAGTVNMQPASANTSRDRSEAQFRVDSWGGYRTSLDLNRVLMKNKLAVRGSAVYHHEGFDRKPSGTDTTRLNAMVNYRPFKYTKLNASYAYYHLTGNRPNNTMPRDTVTGWRKAGSPTWDPITATAKINGVPVPGTWTATSLPPYFSNADYRAYRQSVLFVDQQGLGYWGPYRTTSTTTPDIPDQNIFVVDSVTEPLRAGQPLFSGEPTVMGKDLYDWSRINLSAVNSEDVTARTTSVQLEQFFLDTPRQQLGLQAGYFLEDTDSYTEHIIGQRGSAGTTGFLYVDVNERMVDGSPNPYFLRPFIGIFGLKSRIDNPLSRETSRLQLAYRLDLRRESNLLRWLGMHQVSLYGEHKDAKSRQISYRDNIVSKLPWHPASLVSGDWPPYYTEPAIHQSYVRYYVGDNVGQNVDYAPTQFEYGTYNYRWGNGVTGVFVNEQAELGQAIGASPTGGPSGGNNNSRNVLKTKGAVLQSHLLGDRLVTTFGVRKDLTYAKVGAPLRIITGGPNAIEMDRESWKKWATGEWLGNEGETRTAGVVVRPVPWLSLYANKSDSFVPAAFAIDLQLQPVPNPEGTGEDYGFALNLFEGKFVMRVNRYKTEQINARSSANRTTAQRVRQIDLQAVGFRTNLLFNLIDKAYSWVDSAAATQGKTLTTAERDAQVTAITGLEQRFLDSNATDSGFAHSRLTETGDIVAKGTEIEINYNPSVYWRSKLNVTEQQSIDARLSPVVVDWINERMPYWTSIIDPDIGRPWFTERYGNQQSATEWLAVEQAKIKIANSMEGKSRPQIRRYRANLSTSYSLAGMTDHRIMKRLTVGTGLRWEDKGAIGYYGVQSLPAVITDLDPNRPIYDKSHLYVDAFVGYRTKLFSDKVDATFQLNVRNLQESGRLQTIAAYPDGTPSGLRIIDPRQFIFTVTFNL